MAMATSSTSNTGPNPPPSAAGGGRPLTAVPSLSRCRTVELSRLQREQRIALFDLLDEFSGKKMLVVDEDVLPLLDLILTVEELREHGAEVRRLSHSPNFGNVVSDCNQMIFLVRSTNAYMMIQISKQIKTDEMEQKERGKGKILKYGIKRERKALHDRTYVLAFCPRKYESSLHVLKESNTLSSIHFVRELPSLSLFAIDDDLISMEMPSVYSDFYLHQVTTSLYEVAIAIASFEKCFTKIPKIYSVGKMAKFVADVLGSERFSNGSLSSIGCGGNLGNSITSKIGRSSVQDQGAANNSLGDDFDFNGLGQQQGGNNYMSKSDQSNNNNASMYQMSISNFRHDDPIPQSQMGIPRVLNLNQVTVAATSGQNSGGGSPLQENDVTMANQQSLDTNQQQQQSIEQQNRRQAAGQALNSALNGGQDVMASVDSIILIDRRADMASVMCSQFIYEAVLDTIYPIKANKIQVPSEISGDIHGTETNNTGIGSGFMAQKQQQQNQNSGPGSQNNVNTIRVCNDDNIYREIKHLQVGECGVCLSKKIKHLVQIEKQRDQVTNISDMQQYMTKIKQLSAEKPIVQAHTNILGYIAPDNEHIFTDFSRQWKMEDDMIQGCDERRGTEILQMIEDGLDYGWKLVSVLRLMCLYCTTCGGIPLKILESIKRGICQIHGFETLGLLQNLESVGLLYVPGANNSANRNFQETAGGITQNILKVGGGGQLSGWPLLRKELNLLVTDEQLQNTDISFAYNGYAPLSIRLVEKLRSPKGFRQMSQEALSTLEQPVCEVERYQDENSNDIMNGMVANNNNNVNNSTYRQTVTSGNSSQQGLNQNQNLDNSSTSNQNSSSRKPTGNTFIFFIGGVTYSEIACLKRLSDIENGERKFLIGTTNITNPEKLFYELEPKDMTTYSKKVKLACDVPREKRPQGASVSQQEPETKSRGWFGLG